jgi:hypothetical protein
MTVDMFCTGTFLNAENHKVEMPYIHTTTVHLPVYLGEKMKFLIKENKLITDSA